MPDDAAVTMATARTSAAGAWCRVLRVKEALLMVGFPTAAGLFGMTALTVETAATLAGMVVSLAWISLSVYAANAWAGWDADANDPKFVGAGDRVGRSRRVGLGVASLVTLALGLAAWSALVEVPIAAVAALWLLWLLYSHPRGLKQVPFGGIVAHLLGGAWLFLVPYGMFRTVDARGAALGAAVTLAFAAGHLNHEVMDRDADALSGLRTTAVARGAGFAHRLGLALALLAYLAAIVGGAYGIVPSGEAVPFVIAAPIHLGLGLRALRSGLSSATAATFRCRYRLVFGAAVVAALAAQLVSLTG